MMDSLSGNAKEKINVPRVIQTTKIERKHMGTENKNILLNDKIVVL